MSTFVELPSESVFGFLQNTLGFTRVGGEYSREVVFSRPHERDPAVQVRVYTSIAGGRTTARSCGKDAIRVVLLVDGRGAWKAKRVHRTGTVEGVLERVRERAREAYAVANGILKTPRCACGGRRYGDSGKCMNGTFHDVHVRRAGERGVATFMAAVDRGAAARRVS